MHCDNEYETQAITVEAALDDILDNTKPIKSTDTISVENALDRVLAKDYQSITDVPPHRNSAMDGYAFKHHSALRTGSKLRIIGDSLAGQPYTGSTLSENECIRIMTGAVMPEIADSVVMIEHIEECDGEAVFQQSPQAHQHIRKAGEDVQKHAMVLPAGKRLTPADMSLLYACGIQYIEVFSRPKVTFFTTGDELKQPGQTLQHGDIYDSNRLSLTGMLQKAGCELNSLGVIPDDKAKLSQAFEKAQSQSDCVISTGGVSVGAADHIKSILNQHGQTTFWRIAMKPGRPLTFGRLNKAMFFGLPGNPVSVMATFYLFVLPALRKLAGETDYLPMRLLALCKDPIRKRPGRTDFQRGLMQYEPNNNTMTVSLVGKQQSHLLSGMSQANCFIELPRDASDLSANSMVTVIPFSGLI